MKPNNSIFYSLLTAKEKKIVDLIEEKLIEDGTTQEESNLLESYYGNIYSEAISRTDPLTLKELYKTKLGLS